MKANGYSCWARYYDKDPRHLYSDDIPFYVQRASGVAGEILELACGTGRVTIPIAQSGLQITGLDHSPAMLEVFRGKLARQSPDCRARITIVEGDMSNFTFPRQFALIIVPFRSFQALTSRSDQTACLTAIKRHLTPGGEVILDVFRPTQRLDASWIGPKKQDWTCRDPETGQTITRFSTQRAMDVSNQLLEIEVTFSISSPSGGSEEFTELLKLSYFYEEQFVELVEQSGFVVTERYGYYDGRPVSAGGELLFVCKEKVTR